MKEAFKGHKRK